MAKKQQETKKLGTTPAPAARTQHTPAIAGQGAQSRGSSTQRTAGMLAVRDVRTLTDELAAGEWVKKADVVSMGVFNIVGAWERENTYRNRRTQQYVFELQFHGTDDVLAGTRALMSMEHNVVREKFFKAVKKYGGVGPLVLTVGASDSPEMSPPFVFAHPDDVDPNAQVDLSNTEQDDLHLS